MNLFSYSCPLGLKAWPVIDGQADIKTCNQDFVVDENLDFEPSGAGEHLYLQIQKNGENTAFVGRALARAFGVGSAAVSYAGMKDRHAVTSQWFSIQMPHLEESLQRELDLGTLKGDGLEKVTLLQHTRHVRKLRRGQVEKNNFIIILRAVTTEHTPLKQRLKDITKHGFPNYFGEQRFGNDNMDLARRWMEVRRSRKIPGFKKALHISVLRSFLFNRVLSARIHDNSWNKLLPGEYLDKGNPTGPLWGRGSGLTSSEAEAIEQLAVAPYSQILDTLEHVGLKKEQRSLVAHPVDLEWSFTENTLRLKFALSGGQYATSLLRELLDVRDVNPYAKQKTIQEVEKV